MARCNCAPCLVCGYGKCDCECVDGGPYLTADAANARFATTKDLPTWLRWVADELEKRDTAGGTFAPGIAQSLRGRAYVLSLVADKREAVDG